MSSSSPSNPTLVTSSPTEYNPSNQANQRGSCSECSGQQQKQQQQQQQKDCYSSNPIPSTNPSMNAYPSPSTGNFASTPGATSHIQQTQQQQQQQQQQQSPCFIHSHLDKTLAANNRTYEPPMEKRLIHPGATRFDDSTPASSDHFGLQNSQSSHASQVDLDINGDDEDEISVTRQLARTAVSVREMSKQLGRARVKSQIQSAMIITKARDNHLIKLTREIALHLMLTPRDNTGRGLIVYVDAQLRNSKRFDAAGIERDYPHLFRPTVSRRGSRNASYANLKRGFTQCSSEDNNNNNNNNNNKSTTSSASSTSPEDKDEGQMRFWTAEMCRQYPHLFDLVITLGGDGTVLFASWLFQTVVPPVIPFSLGSLGFLTNFDYPHHPQVLARAIESGVRVNLRMRFTCTVYRATLPDDMKKKDIRAVRSGRTGEIYMNRISKGGWEAVENGAEKNCHLKPAKDREVMCFSTRPAETFEILNDLVVDRGPSPYVSLLELFGDEHHMTTVQADGLCVATPTGSTAYSLSAGGSLVHPEIPAILISPICPHTLSFRPMLLPDSMELRIVVPYNSRSTAWASFDGRGRVELKQGDHIKVTASPYPFPTVCHDKQSTDWFHAIARTLKWNERQRQKSFVVVEENHPSQDEAAGSAGDENNRSSDKAKAKATAKANVPTIFTNREPKHESDDDDDSLHDKVEDVDEEEEDTYDIDETVTSDVGAWSNSSPSQNDEHVQGSVQLLGVPDEEAEHADITPTNSRHGVEGTDPVWKPRGDTGERDDIREPLEMKAKTNGVARKKRTSDQRIVLDSNGDEAKNEKFDVAAAVEAGERDRRHHYKGKHPQHQHQHQYHSYQQHYHHPPHSPDIEDSRAFAVYGQDASDTSASE